MIYVCDSDSFRVLSHYYPKTFKSLWESLDRLVQQGEFLSAREVLNEFDKKLPSLGFMDDWVKNNKGIFVTPSADEMLFVAEVFKIAHFRESMGQQKIARGEPHADPFIIAAAKVRNGTVVTQEKLKPNAPKIPNVCQHFGVPCMNIEAFFEQQGWSF